MVFYAYGGLLAFATLPLTNALGCYSGGLPFEDLHGGASNNDLDMVSEVEADINSVCNMVDGAVFKKGDPPFTHCSRWKVTVEPDPACCMDILGVQIANCDLICGVAVGSFNHIDWEINYIGEAEELTMTHADCTTALLRERGGCDTGSEQNYDNFWYKIDPQDGDCPGGAPAPTTLVTSTTASSTVATTLQPTDDSAPTLPY